MECVQRQELRAALLKEVSEWSGSHNGEAILARNDRPGAHVSKDLSIDLIRIPRKLDGKIFPSSLY